MKKLISAFVAFIAFIFVLGSVGAYDNGSINFLQFFFQASIGVLVVWIAFQIMNKKEK